MGDILYYIVYYNFMLFGFLGLMITIGISDRARYMLKFLLYVLFFLLFTTASTPWTLTQGRHPRNGLPFCRCLSPITKLMGAKFKVRGEENIAKDTGSVVVVNHQSALDISVVCILILTLKNCVPVMKKSLQYCASFGLLCWSANSIFLDRGKSVEARNSLNSAISAIQNEKIKVIIFPEGHRHGGRTLLPFKKGAFYIAIEAQAPIQPVVTSKYYFLDHKKKRFDSGTSYINILPAIPTKGMTKKDLPKLLETTYELMDKVFKETSQEVLNEHLNELKSELSK